MTREDFNNMTKAVGIGPKSAEKIYSTLRPDMRKEGNTFDPDAPSPSGRRSFRSLVNELPSRPEIALVQWGIVDLSE